MLPSVYGLSFPHYVCQWARRLSRVKLAVICGARSAPRQQSCLNCDLRCERIHCVRKYDGRFIIIGQSKMVFIFTNVYYIYDQTDTREAQRRALEEAGGAEQHSINWGIPCKEWAVGAWWTEFDENDSD